MASGFEEILRKFDLAHTEGCSAANRMNVVVTDLKQMSDGLFRGVSVVPEGISSACALSDVLRFRSREIFQPVTISWDSDRLPPGPNAGMYTLMHVQIVVGAPFDMHVDGDCVPVCMEKPSNGPLRLLEMCAGGYGGWSKAAHVAARFSALSFRTLSIESDLHAAWTFCVSNGASLVDGSQLLPLDFLDSCHDLMLHANLNDWTWLSTAGLWGIEVACLSAPCQPWSTAGASLGLDSEDGMVFGQAIGACKVLKPKILLVEQVPGFHAHPHRDYIIRLLRWAGYSVKYAKVVDSGDVGAATRARWLAMAVLASDPSISAREFQVWLKFADVNPCTYGVVLSQDWTLDSRLWPDADILRMASDPLLLPPTRRKRLTPDQVLDSRCHMSTSKVPTIVASYGSQHCLSPASLENRGLLCHFLLDGNKPRFWHPMEILLMHSFLGSQFLDDDWKLAYKFLGNQITIPHALLLLVNAVACLPDRAPAPSLQDLLQQLQMHHVTSETVHVTILRNGLFVACDPLAVLPQQVQNIEDFWTQGGFQIPLGHVWSIEGLSRFDAHPAPQDIVSVASTLPEAMDVTSTCAFVRFLPALNQNKPNVCIWIDATVTGEALESAWNGAFEFHVIEGVSWHILEAFESPSQPCYDRLVFVWKQGSLHVLQPTEESFQWTTEVLGNSLQDVFGLVGSTVFRHALLIHDVLVDPPKPWSHSTLSYVVACRVCQFETCELDDHTAFGVRCAGPSGAVTTVLDFWSSLLPDSLTDSLGFRIQVLREDCSFKLQFVASESTPNLPLHLICLHLFSKGLKNLLRPLLLEGQVLVVLKFYSRILWTGCISGGYTGEDVMDIIQSTTFWITHHLRILNFGKQFDWRLPLRELANHKGELHLSLLYPMHGGGPTSTKNSHRLQIQNALASSLLEEGYDLHWTTESVAKVMAKVGLKDLSKILTPKTHSRLSIAKQILKDCSIDLPKIKPMLVSQTAFHKKARMPVQLNPQNYRVIDGALLNQDKTPTAFLPSFGIQQHGYHCVSPVDAQPWLKSSETLSKDELALVIFGDPGCEIQRPHLRVTLPCTDERNQPVLIATVLVQCGEKAVVVHDGDGFRVTSDATSLLAVTVEAEDFPQLWSEITQSPYRYFRALPFLRDEIVSVWGKSFRKGKLATTPDDSASLQVHMMVKTASLPAILKAAGSSKVWCTPKSDDGKPDTNWRLLWLDGSLDFQAASILCAKLTTATGLVRLKGRFAIRVSKGNYEDAWTTIFPGLKAPEVIDVDSTWRIDSLPYGVTKDMLVEWGSHNRWPLKPIRALGAKSWIVGAKGSPPQLTLHFNGSPVLVREAGLKAATMHPIIAGPRPQRTHVAQPVDLLQSHGDPWANWSGSSTLPAKPPVPSASVAQGPTETKFSQQEARIEKLETVLTQMQTSQAEQNAALKQVQQDVQSKDIELRKHMDTRLEAVKMQLSDSFARA